MTPQATRSLFRAFWALLPLLLIAADATAQQTSGRRARTAADIQDERRRSVSEPTPNAQTAAASASPADALVLTHVVGEWTGVYFLYPQPMGLDLNLRSSGGMDLVGDFTFYPLETGQQSALGTVRGKYEVRGAVDPVTLTLDLSPGRWIERPTNLLVTAVGVQGFVSTDRNQIGGFLTIPYRAPDSNAPHFALARPDKGGDDLAKHMVEAVKSRGKGLGGMFSKGPNDRKLLSWAVRLRTEFPDVADDRLYTLQKQALNLFEDDHFREHFGKTFDELGGGERAAVSESFRKSKNELNSYRWLERAFSSVGAGGAPETMLGVFTQRVIRAWKNEKLQKMNSLPPELDAFEELSELKASAERLTPLWPSEVDHFLEQITASGRRLAGPALLAWTDRTVGAAQGYEGLQRLDRWQTETAGLQEYVSEADRSLAQSKIEARIQQIFEPLVSAETAKLGLLGEGYDAVAAGNQWHSNFVDRYGFLYRRQEFQDAIGRLSTRRNADLEKAKDRIARQLLHAATVEEVDALVDALLVPMDRDTQAGAAIRELIEARKDRIDIERRFSDGELALMKPGTTTIEIPPFAVPPGSTEIGLAFLREMEAVGGKLVNRTTGHYTTMILGSLLGWYLIVEIERITIHQTDALSDGSFRVSYRLKPNYRVPPEIKSFPSWPIDIMNNLAADRTDNFRLTHSGWRSPTLNDAWFVATAGR